MRAIQIHAAGNTYNPCLIVLAEKGYALTVENGDATQIWVAKKGECTFSGSSPPELLGIVALGETFGNDWNRQEPDLLGKICPELRA
jgi:hypothetical protein